MICKNCGYNHAIRERVTAEKIIDSVCEYYGIKPELLLQRCRKAEIVLPRQVSHYMIRKFTGLSFPEIGKKFNLDHTTIINSYNTIKNHLSTNHESKEDIEFLYTLFGKEADTTTLKPLSDTDRKFILENHLYMTISEMSDYLGKRYDSIRGFCRHRKLNFKRKSYRPPKEIIKPKEKVVYTKPPAVYTNSRSPYGIADELHNKKIA